MTKEMYDKCRNEKMVAWAGLPQDVRDYFSHNLTICLNSDIEFLNGYGNWEILYDKGANAASVLRIHERCKPDGYEYVPVMPNDSYGLKKKRWTCIFNPPELPVALCSVIDFVGFAGIEYRLPGGATTWAMTVDQSIGVPVRVRFKK